MAAYAALVSLTYVIEQIKHHPRPPISLDKQQVQSLTGKLTFLQEFLESGYNSHVGYRDEADPLEMRIADAAYAAEYIIESRIADQLLAESTSQRKKFTPADWYQFLQEVIESMDSIKKEVMQINRMEMEYQMPKDLSISSDSFRSPPSGKNSAMVGFDEIREDIMNTLIGQQSNLQIIPIVGMGGIGKTTLARTIYHDQLIVQHFDVCAWVTISQEYSVREILLELLCYLKKEERKEKLSQLDEFKLGEILYKCLSGGRYLIIMDDVWSIEVWNEVGLFFPDSSSGSRIMITTRLRNLAVQLSGSQCYGLIEMDFLDEKKSWNLLCQNVFREKSCPIELKEIGMEIARNCKGLPLSIVVIGRLLAKSNWTCEYWEYIAKNLNSIVNLEDDKRCLQILYMSYYQLPVHLKPCFLFMGVFPETKVFVSQLIHLWVAEGFIKPIGGKTLEDVAEENVMELIDRNMILVNKWGSSGRVNRCQVHDLVRDLCLREADKQNFHGLIKQQQNPKDRIIPIPKEHLYWSVRAREEMSFSTQRSIICPPFSFSWALGHFWEDVSFDDQVRNNKQFQDGILQLFYLRYLSYPHLGQGVPSSIFYRFWNLHTLSFRGTSATAPPEIWKMALLRHVEFIEIHLPDPPTQDDFVLGNLRTLYVIKVWNLREEVVERIPDTKKLKICLGKFERWSIHYLNNLDRLHKLESLHCLSLDEGIRSELLHNLVFPRSLKKLTLYGSNLQWDDMATKIGSLPFLQVLKLRWQSFSGPEWETVEGQFCNLKFLQIERCCSLKYWKTDKTHFPSLEHLQLGGLKELTEIPSDIGDIPTLQSIKLENCSYSSVISARTILEEQEELGNESLQVRVTVEESDREIKSLSSHNFQVEIRYELKFFIYIVFSYSWCSLLKQPLNQLIEGKMGAAWDEVVYQLWCYIAQDKVVLDLGDDTHDPVSTTLGVSRLKKRDLPRLYLKLLLLLISKTNWWEEVAQVYLEELIDRNLVLVEKCNSYGKVKTCKIHDLMRDLCLREAQKQKFLSVLSDRDLNISQGRNRERCISIHQNITEKGNFLDDLKTLSDTRSLHMMGKFRGPLSPFCLKLLRVYSMEDGYYFTVNDRRLEVIFQQVNLRYIALKDLCGFDMYLSSFTFLWNLRTLILRNCAPLGAAPSEIWMMHQLRHVVVQDLHLPDPLVAAQMTLH